MKEKEMFHWEKLYDKQPFIRKHCWNARHLLWSLSFYPDWALLLCGSWEIPGERTDVGFSSKWLQQMLECGRDSCVRSEVSCESAGNHSTETLSWAWTLALLSGRTYISGPMRVWWLYHMSERERLREWVRDLALHPSSSSSSDVSPFFHV